jgi:hypothetical protein
VLPDPHLVICKDVVAVAAAGVATITVAIAETNNATQSISLSPLLFIIASFSLVSLAFFKVREKYRENIVARGMQLVIQQVHEGQKWK